MACRQIFCNKAPQPTGSSTIYTNPCGPVAWSGTEASVVVRWLENGAVGNLRVELPTAPGAGKTRVFTVRINSVDTAVTLTLSNTDTVATAALMVPVAINDLISLSQTPSGTPTASGTPRITLEVTGTTAGVSCYGGGTASNLGTSTTMVGSVFRPMSWSGAGAFVRHNIVAAPGTLTDYVVDLPSPPGAGKSFTFHVWKNNVKQDGTGGTVDTTIVVPDSAVTGSATFALALAAGDYVHSTGVAAGSPTQSAAIASYRFVATVDGESQFGGVAGNNLALGTTYASPTDGLAHNATETLVDVVGGVSSFVLRDYHVRLDSNSGTTTKDFITRVNAAAPVGGPHVAFATGDPVAKSHAGAVTINTDDRVAVDITVTGTAGVANFSRWTWVQYALAGPVPIKGTFVAGADGKVTSTRTALFNLDGVDRTGAGAVSAEGSLVVGGHLMLIEQADAPAGISNAARLYTEDDGSGKTRLMVRYGSGAPVQLAIEP